MADMLRVILEIGKKRKVVAGATDWPGLDRWGTSEDNALAKLSSYLPRYAGVAEPRRHGERVQAGNADEGRRASARFQLHRLLGRRPRPVRVRAGRPVSQRPG